MRQRRSSVDTGICLKLERLQLAQRFSLTIVFKEGVVVTDDFPTR